MTDCFHTLIFTYTHIFTSHRWHFSKKTAPKPSPVLLLPVTCFLTASMFMSVYWNGNIKPDGSRYEFEGAGVCLGVCV